MEPVEESIAVRPLPDRRIRRSPGCRWTGGADGCGPAAPPGRGLAQAADTVANIRIRIDRFVHIALSSPADWDNSARPFGHNYGTGDRSVPPAMLRAPCLY
jgi:hypothetical protein